MNRGGPALPGPAPIQRALKLRCFETLLVRGRLVHLATRHTARGRRGNLACTLLSGRLLGLGGDLLGGHGILLVSSGRRHHDDRLTATRYRNRRADRGYLTSNRGIACAAISAGSVVAEQGLNGVEARFGISANLPTQ